MTGTSGNDRLVGTEGDDVICGLEGDDRILAGAGNDRIVGGAGKDLINPGMGDDTVWGGDGDDGVNSWTLTGGPGSNPSPEADRFGDDTIYLGAGRDSANTGRDDDIIFAGADYDLIEGGEGNDQLYTGPGAGGDWANGEAGNDYIEVDSQATGLTEIRGETGNDVVLGISLGLTSATGGDGNDIAVLLDGAMDVFTAGDDAVFPFPVIGFPCSPAAGEEIIEITCEFLPSLGASLDTEGTFTFVNPFGEIAADVKTLWETGGTGGGGDVCFCDNVGVPGFPYFKDQIF